MAGQNSQLSSMIERFSRMRTGTVISVNPFFALVDVGTTQIPAAYVRQSTPLTGDVVAVLRQGATWMIIGTTSSSGDNLVQNASFEEVNGENGQPLLWTQYQITNVSRFESVTDESAMDGERVLEVTPVGALTGTSLVYSQPVSVEAGQTVEISAYANGFYPADNPNTADASLRALWFANATNLYPTTSAADSTIATVNNIAETEVMTLLTGTVVVPVGAVFMRVGLRSVVEFGTGLHWDFVTARVVG